MTASRIWSNHPRAAKPKLLPALSDRFICPMVTTVAPPPTEPLPRIAGRRARRRSEIRHRILSAALELFRERGVDGVTVDEIAERADVARATIFNHFPGKDSLCQAMPILQAELFAAAEEEGAFLNLEFEEQVIAAFRLMATVAESSPDHVRELIPRAFASLKVGDLPEHRQAIQARLRCWAADAQLCGAVRSDRTPDEIASFLLGLQLQGTLMWAYGFTEPSLGDHLAYLIRLSLQGLRTLNRAETAARERGTKSEDL